MAGQSSKRTLPGVFLCCIYTARLFQKLLIIKVEVDVQLAATADVYSLFFENRRKFSLQSRKKVI